MRHFLYIYFLLLAACSVQVHPELRQAVNEKLAVQRPSEVECVAASDAACAISSPLLQLGSADKIKNQHHAVLLDIGEHSYSARLHLIRAARHSIEIQNFLFRRDQTGGLLIHELVQAANRGVRVRVMFDQLFTLSDLDYLASLALEHSNFEVRLYNPVFKRAQTTPSSMLRSLACCFRKTNQRMHSKLHIVDGVVGLTGGRNIADRYFDFDTDYDFKDREVLVYGPVAGAMRDSFELFWNSGMVETVGHLRDVAPLIMGDQVPPSNGFEVARRLKPVLDAIEDQPLMHTLFVKTAHRVDSVQYFFDLPHGSDTGEVIHEDTTTGLHTALATARHSVVIQSPYLVLSKRARGMFRKLREEHPDIELLFSTNSLAATDGFAAYSITHKHKKHYVKSLGFHVYEFRPYAADAAEFFPRMPQLIEEKKRGVSSGVIPGVGPNPALEMPGPRTGLHAKSFVIDGRTSMVGSHNLDPRSEGFNTENGVIIHDREFASELEQSIRRDIEPGNSWVVALKPTGNRVFEGINGAIESASRSLPIFDIWPYRSTTVYELRPGGTFMPPGSHGFYENYQPLGSFPDVINQKRRWQVILISSFMGFIAPVL